ncbi:MAG: sugar phosphate isomerase/epimerase family protein [Spirochaetota bacterium]
MARKYSVFLDNVGTAYDRFCAEYAPPFSTEELFRRAKSIDLLSGVDLVASPELIANMDAVRSSVRETGLSVVSIALDIFTQPVWKQGSFSSQDAKVREAAMDHAREVMSLLKEFGSDLLTIWPGQDGYDYLFQADYLEERTSFQNCIAQLAHEHPDMRICLEYKVKEPRTHSYLGTLGMTLLMANATGSDNVGVALDFGHSLYGYENPAESVAILQMYGQKLFHVHINDNYRYWDDDLIVGSVRTLEYLEFLYWLRRTGYSDWITIDQFPYREDGRDACSESAEWLDFFESILDNFDTKRIDEVIRKKDGVAASRLAREMLRTRTS